MIYPSNSETSKKVQATIKPEHVQSVVGAAPEKKVSKLEQILPKSVVNFIKPKDPELLKQQLERSIKLVIIDTIQSALLGNDAKTSGQNMFSTFFNSMSNAWSNPGYTNYGATYNNQTRTYTYGTPTPPPAPQQSPDSSVYRYAQLVYKSKIDADNVLRSLFETLAVYKTVSCFDLYEFSGVPANPLDRSYGWRDLSTAEIGMGGGGWIIRLPKALPLD